MKHLHVLWREAIPAEVVEDEALPLSGLGCIPAATGVRLDQAGERPGLREVGEKAVRPERISGHAVVMCEAWQPVSHRLHERAGETLRERSEDEEVAGAQE